MMRKWISYKLLAVIMLYLFFVECNEHQVMGQPKHNETAAFLLDRIKLNQVDGNILFGHHDDLLNGYTWKYDQNKRLFEQSDIKDVAGDYPAILGFDLGSIEYYGLKFERGNTFTAMIDAIKIHHARGGIVTISAHMRNLITGGSAWDVSRGGIVRSVLRDKDVRNRFYKVLDLYCEFFSHLVDSDGERIPVLFRPWHESNLNCFWWGGNNCSNRDYIRLWRLTYNYIVKEKGVDNLVWVYSPSEITSERAFNTRYPGNKYVDIIGFECYQHLRKNESLEKSSERFKNTMEDGLNLLDKLIYKHNKLGALTETGFASVPDSSWWTSSLCPLLKNHNVAYIYVWGNRYQEKDKVYAPYYNSPDSKDFLEFSYTKQCVLLNRMK